MKDSKQHPKALVVAGNAEILLLVSAMLKHGRVNYITAASDEQGYALAKAELPDVIVALAGKDDLAAELCGLVRADQKLSRTPLVILTTSGNSQTYTRYFANGCDQVLPVPFKSSQLFEAIRKAAECKIVREEENRIRVLYRSGQTDFVSPTELDQLLAGKELLCFQRKDGIAAIGEDPIRCFARADFQGPERRRHSC